MPSQVVLNFLALKNKNSKKVYENMKSKKVNIYEPYLYLKHNKIFEFLIEVLKSDLTNTYIGEEILELFLIYTKRIFFFKCIPNEILLKIILDEENLKKYLTNKKFFELLVGIIAVSPFNYCSFSSHGPLNAKNIIKTSYEFFKKDITKKILAEIIAMHSDKLKDKMLDLSLNSLKEILKSMKNISANYKKCLNNQLNRKDLNSLGGWSGHIAHSTTSNSGNFIQQNIFIGLNQQITSGSGSQGNPSGSSNTSNSFIGLYQNSIIFFNPKEKIINLNMMTEANNKDDNNLLGNNYKDVHNRSQVNFKNCKQYMNKVLVLLRVYMQSYFQTYMSSVLNEYLKLNNNYNNSVGSSCLNGHGFGNQFGISHVSNSNISNHSSNPLSFVLGGSVNSQNILNALMQISNFNNSNNNFGQGNIVNSNNNSNLNILLTSLANLQALLSTQQQNPLLSTGLNLNNINLSSNTNSICNMNQMQNNLLFQNGNFNNNLNFNSINTNNKTNNNFVNNPFCYSSQFNNASSSIQSNNFYNNNNTNNNNNNNTHINSLSSPHNSIINTQNNALTANHANNAFNFLQNQNNQYNQNINTNYNLINNIFTSKMSPNSNFYNLDSAVKDHHQSGLNIGEAEKLKHLCTFYSSFLESLYDIRNLAYFKPSVAMSLLYTLFSLKDVLSRFGDEFVLKTIYLVLNIGWTQYENEIHKIFNDNFNIKFRKFEYEKIRSFETPLKKEFINFLADVIVYSIVDKVSNGHNILSTLNAIFRNKTNRESIFLDICRWNVISKSIRDNMKNEYRNNMQENSQVFIGTK